MVYLLFYYQNLISSVHLHQCLFHTCTQHWLNSSQILHTDSREDVMLYSEQYQNCQLVRCLEKLRCKIWPIPLTSALVSNTGDWVTTSTKETTNNPELKKRFILPSSLNTKESVWTRSQNLYVSQHTKTGMLCALATSATWELPIREVTKPFANNAWAPKNTLVTCNIQSLMLLPIITRGQSNLTKGRIAVCVSGIDMPCLT